MATDLRCVVCGELLVEEVSSDEIVLPGGERVPFRRHTDFVTCPACLSMYRASDLQRGLVEPVSDAELPGPRPEGEDHPRRRSEDV